jgi:transcriptional antiterminator
MGEVTGRKDDWIALQLGVSGRTIRNYRKSVEEKRSGETANNDEQASAKKEQTPLEKQMIRTLKALEKFQKMASKDNDKDDVCNAIQNCMDTLKWYGLQYGLLQGEER